MRRWQVIVPLALTMFLLEPVISARLNAETTESELGGLVEHISQVEHDLGGIESRVYTDRPDLVMTQADAAASTEPQPNDQPSDQATDRLMDRVDGLEQEVRDLTDQVEQLGNRLDQLQQQFDQFSGKSAPAQSGQQGAAPSAATPSTADGGADNAASGSGLAPGASTLGQIPAGSAASEGTYQDQYNTALGYLRAQDYQNAEAALKNFIAQHGDTDLAGSAVYWLGETYYVQNDFTDAAQQFLLALKKYPTSPKAAESMLKLGMSLAAINQSQQACAAFRDLPKKYPNASATITQRAKVESKRDKCK